jgi:hypothetical protein
MAKKRNLPPAYNNNPPPYNNNKEGEKKEEEKKEEEKNENTPPPYNYNNNKYIKKKNNNPKPQPQPKPKPPPQPYNPTASNKARQIRKQSASRVKSVKKNNATNIKPVMAMATPSNLEVSKSALAPESASASASASPYASALALAPASASASAPASALSYQQIKTKFIGNPRFFEQQTDGNGCGRHALNNLFGDKVYTSDKYNFYITDENINSFNLDINNMFPIQNLCRYLENSYRNIEVSIAAAAINPDDTTCPADEMYDITVLQAAIGIMGYTAIAVYNFRTPTYIPPLDNPDFIGYICCDPINRHWIAFKYNFDTKNFKYINSVDIEYISNMDNPKFSVTTEEIKVGERFKKYTSFIEVVWVGNSTFNLITRTENNTTRHTTDIFAVAKANCNNSVANLFMGKQYNTTRREYMNKLQELIKCATGPSDVDNLTMLLKLNPAKISKIFENHRFLLNFSTIGTNRFTNFLEQLQQQIIK